jgi:MFS family permease
MLPIRGVLFAVYRNPELIVLYQLLDGISAAALGIMVPLVVADLTRGTGRFNLAIGIVGLAVGVGGALSTALAGTLTDHIGNIGTFLALAAIGQAAYGVVAAAMPETHPERTLRRRPPGLSRAALYRAARRQAALQRATLRRLSRSVRR